MISAVTRIGRSQHGDIQYFMKLEAQHSGNCINQTSNRHLKHAHYNSRHWLN